MSTHASPRVAANDHDSSGAVTPRSRTRRLSTETKAAFKTTEFFSYVAVLAGILIAGAVVDSADAGGYGARQVWPVRHDLDRRLHDQPRSGEVRLA